MHEKCTPLNPMEHLTLVNCVSAAFWCTFGVRLVQ